MGKHEILSNSDQGKIVIARGRGHIISKTLGLVGGSQYVKVHSMGSWPPKDY